MGRLGKFVFALAFSVSTLVLGADATAGPQWCEEDPIFLVNGSLVDVTTAFPTYAQSSVKSVHFELLVPRNAIAAVVTIPAKVPTTASISHVLSDRYLLAVPIVVKVTVTASSSFETRTRVVGTYLSLATWVYGKSNVTTQVKYSLIGL